MAIFFDTQSLIFLVRSFLKEPTRGLEERDFDMPARARAFFDAAESTGEKFCLPAISYTEFLSYSGAADQFKRFESQLLDVFPIADFNAICAYEAASLWKRAYSDNQTREDYQSPQAEGWRRKFKAHTLILGTVIGHQANAFVTQDRGILNLAERLEVPVEVMPFPELPKEEGQLFS